MDLAFAKDWRKIGIESHNRQGTLKNKVRDAGNEKKGKPKLGTPESADAIKMRIRTKEGVGRKSEK